MVVGQRDEGMQELGMISNVALEGPSHLVDDPFRQGRQTGLGENEKIRLLDRHLEGDKALVTQGMTITALSIFGHGSGWLCVKRYTFIRGSYSEGFAGIGTTFERA